MKLGGNPLCPYKSLQFTSQLTSQLTSQGSRPWHGCPAPQLLFKIIKCHPLTLQFYSLATTIIYMDDGNPSIDFTSSKGSLALFLRLLPRRYVQGKEARGARSGASAQRGHDERD